MRILVIGDIVGKSGFEFIKSKIKKIRVDNQIDLVIANGENIAEGNGILPFIADSLFNNGIDIITGGNHSFRKKEIFPYLNSNHKLLRPYNYPSATTPGVGLYKLNLKGINVAVINMLGVVYLESLRSPFEALDEAINRCNDCLVKVVDFHAEATAEKQALAFYVDGKISVFFGTHTHVQTSDEQILPNGTGYITDVGMTGVIDSVLGVKKELSIKRMKNKLPVKFENATGDCRIECAIFEVDETNGKTISIQRLRIT